jgi:hypothetical protein
MSRKEEILNEPEIAEFLQTHRGAAKELKRAVEILAGKSDDVAALKKLFPALENKAVFVFFSYKGKDEPTASAVVQALRENSAEKLQISYQAEFTESIVGKKWREWIRKMVRQANWFILLLPDPSDDYDWCLFETGQFEAQLTSADRMICLHHPHSKIPDPIEGYHAVAATIPEVEKFLRMIYLKENPIPGMDPINKAIAKKIPEIAKDIVDAISPPRKKLYRVNYEPWIGLKVPNAKELKHMDDLDDALIWSANNEALDLFDFLQQPRTLGELRSGLPEGKEDSRWRNELFHVVRKVASGRKFFPIQAVFQTNEGRMYRPVLCAVDRIGRDGPIDVFHVTFAEEVSAIDNTAIPQPISTIATLLRFSFRFKWEVLERFCPEPLKEQDVVRVENALRRINKDWESRGIGGEEAIMNLFSNAQAKRVKKMFENWYKLRNDKGTGELDIAIENRDTEQIRKLLVSFSPTTHEFLEMTTIRFTELLSTK